MCVQMWQFETSEGLGQEWSNPNGWEEDEREEDIILAKF